MQDDLIELVGAPYVNHWKDSKLIEGHIYTMYESMEFSITFANNVIWRRSITLASLVTATLGLVMTTATGTIVCYVLGIAYTVAGELIAPGSINKYNCLVMYTRHITVDGGTHPYSYAYKFINYVGLEDADLNSTERAYVVPDSALVYYGTTEEYYLTGLFDEAYIEYTGWYG